MHRTICLLALLAACSIPTREDYVESRPELKNYEKKAILARELRLGMTQEMVRVIMQKHPPRTGRTKRYDRTVERWSYPGITLYFDDEGYLVYMEGPS